MTDQEALSDTAPGTDIDPEAAEQKLAPGSSVKRRNKLLDLARDTVLSDTRVYAVEDALNEDIKAKFDAEGVTASGGRPRVVVDLVNVFERLLQAMGADVWLTRLEFGNSVTIEMRPVVSEEVAKKVHDRVAKEPNGVVTHEDLKDLIPLSVAAANTTARLLDVPGEAAFVEARRYGTEVAWAYESFAKAIDQHKAVVTVEAPGGRRARYDSHRAEVALETLKTAAKLPSILVTIVGTLTRADSDEALFRVTLDRDRMPPEFDARRRVVDGRYTTRAREQVQAEGLWDTRVVARVRAWQVQEPGKRKPTFERFQFEDIRHAAS